MLSEILERYRDQKPMDLRTAVEISYPVSAVIRMMEDYHKYKVNELRLADVTKSVCDGCGSTFNEMDIAVKVCYCCQKEIKQTV